MDLGNGASHLWNGRHHCRENFDNCDGRIFKIIREQKIKLGAQYGHTGHQNIHLELSFPDLSLDE